MAASAILALRGRHSGPVNLLGSTDVEGGAEHTLSRAASNLESALDGNHVSSVVPCSHWCFGPPKSACVGLCFLVSGSKGKTSLCPGSGLDANLPRAVQQLDFRLD